MPTTYTPLLGVALPATGELAGTWGTTVNDGITSLLDSAIAGTTTLSTDANVTLTTTTGAANQARQAILLCSGARTGVRNITAPATSKTYVVINATTGGFAVQLVGAGPTAGISIAAGERVVAAWNGSDFVKVSSNLVTGTATRIPFFDASGLLSSAADFVRDASGNVGIGTTPVSGIRLVMRTAAVSDAAFAADNGTNSGFRVQFAANLTSIGNDFNNPLVLLTNNLERMRIDSSGNVGIGRTPTGSAVVDVQSAAAGILRIRGGTGTNQGSSVYGTVGSDTTTWAIGARATIYGGTPGNDSAVYSLGTLSLGSAAVPDRVLIDSSGNVGIGQTSPQTALGFANAATISWGATNYPYISGDQVNNTLLFGTQATERMRIDASGNVGIGRVASGGLRLDVAGGGRVAELILENAGSAGTLGTSPGLYSPASGQLAISTNAAERMRIDSSGNVGIGTATPGARLEVNGNINTSAAARLGYLAQIDVATIAGVSTAAYGLTLGASFTGLPNPGTMVSGYGGLLFATGAIERMRIDSSGNVGIGTASPAAKLDVRGTNSVLSAVASDESGNSIMDTRNSNAANAVQFFVAHLGSQVLMGNARANALQLWTNGAERMRITSTGNIVAGASAALATTATDGFLYVPTCAGTPTGTPTAITGMAPIVVNTTNNKLYFYSGGAWRDAGP